MKPKDLLKEVKIKMIEAEETTETEDIQAETAEIQTEEEEDNSTSLIHDYPKPHS